MEIIIENHLKMHLPHCLREVALRFYTDILGCRKLTDIPHPNVNLYEFQGGFVLGLWRAYGRMERRRISKQEFDGTLWLILWSLRGLYRNKGSK
jgi:hypothetical protein